MVSFNYITPDLSRSFQKEVWVNKIHYNTLDKKRRSFELLVEGVGKVKCVDDVTTYSLKHESFTFDGTTKSRLPWNKQDKESTPGGLYVNLPLPVHWHVQSLASQCDFKLSIPSHPEQAEDDKEGVAMVHQEKNWATSFPKGYIWIQARSHENDSGFCCAGGKLLGTEPYLMGYRNKDYSLDFIPPYALMVFGYSPFMTTVRDFDKGLVKLSVQSFRRKMEITAKAPTDTFFTLSAPLPEGHREAYCTQSFRADVDVKVYESSWFGPWRLVREESFPASSLEFGGDYYPQAGKKIDL